MKDHLQGMRVFAQVVDSKSFSGAAQKLGMSKSLASRHVTALEQGFSVKLLHRSTRKLSLTEAGAVLYEHCARIVQLAEQRVTRAQSEPAGLVRLTMDAVRAAVVAGLGTGNLPAYMAGDALERGELVPILRTYRVAADSAIYLVYLPNRTLPSRVRAVIDFPGRALLARPPVGDRVVTPAQRHTSKTRQNIAGFGTRSSFCQTASAKPWRRDHHHRSFIEPEPRRSADGLPRLVAAIRAHSRRVPASLFATR